MPEICFSCGSSNEHGNTFTFHERDNFIFLKHFSYRAAIAVHREHTGPSTEVSIIKSACPNKANQGLKYKTSIWTTPLRTLERPYINFFFHAPQVPLYRKLACQVEEF